MIFTDDTYNHMIEVCKRISAEFKNDTALQRKGLDPLNNEDDIDKMEVSEDELANLFERFA